MDARSRPPRRILRALSFLAAVPNENIQQHLQYHPHDDVTRFEQSLSLAVKKRGSRVVIRARKRPGFDLQQLVAGNRSPPHLPKWTTNLWRCGQRSC
jgi:hypothetical protein